MEKLTIPQTLRNNITFHSSYCEKHTYTRGGKEIVKPIQRMVINGEVVCPRCQIEQQEAELQKNIQQEVDKQEKLKKYNVLERYSVLSDETIKEATFDNYIAETTEEITNKKAMLEVVERIKNGQVFNTIVQGNQGAGKSHLSYAALKALNRKPSFEDKDDNGISNLFVNMEEMTRLIRDSFNNRESKYTEIYFIDLLSEVDVLVLDDLGAETGSIDSEKKATDFTHRILYAIMTARQNKPTIITTNLSGEWLFKMYDKKVVSRIFRSPYYVIFKETKDKRISKIPF